MREWCACGVMCEVMCVCGVMCACGVMCVCGVMCMCGVMYVWSGVCVHICVRACVPPLPVFARLVLALCVICVE